MSLEIMHRPTVITIVSVVAIACGLMASGCGPGGPATYPVTGTATLDGQPIPEGDIIFADAAKLSPPSAGKIKDGKFTANVTAGKKNVEIRASKMMPLPGGQTGAMGEKEMPQDYIPAKYNSQTELTMEVSSGPNTQDFKLESK